MTPSCYDRPIKFEEENSDRRLRKGCLEFLTNLVACLHLMVGTVLLGSVIFITLADVLPVIESFVDAALVTRLVATIDFQGMRMANHPKVDIFSMAVRGGKRNVLLWQTTLREAFTILIRNLRVFLRTDIKEAISGSLTLNI